VSPSGSRATVEQYHDGTKHYFDRFARSLGYLDWASQPHPFRAYTGAQAYQLYPAPAARTDDYSPLSTTYGQLFDPPATSAQLTAAAIGDLLRHALGLSAWKQFGSSRWALRVNPSSGNLHPTEAYVVCRGLHGLADTPAVYHYAPDRHALELRCAFDERAWTAACGDNVDMLLIALSSIHWREAWKYGERAFRYCQHDLGHAIAAIAFGAALAGWRAMLLPGWPHRSIAALTGIDRDADFTEAEREEPGCILAIAPPGSHRARPDASRLVDAVANGRWSGHASQLSEDHVQWTFIDEVARATEDPAPAIDAAFGAAGSSSIHLSRRGEKAEATGALNARTILLQRRSALAFDGQSSVERSAFFEMLSRLTPELFWWSPRIHLAIFVHRVDGLAPGLYLFGRDPEAVNRLKRACRRDFLWQAAHDDLPFMCLARGDCRLLAARLSCDQEIAADGFFSLGMIAEFNASLDAFGPQFYRNLFWESGVVGQILYLEAEAAGARATGIGCFYDDPVHEVLGLEGHAFQSLYHFSVGMPVEDLRLTTEPGYGWET
jgi:SagB-type dehydrogenase family enzyme